MNNIILDGAVTDNLVMTLNTPHLATFAKELNHIYGLKAYAEDTPPTSRNKAGRSLMMSRDDGIPVCEIWMTIADDDKPVFNYYSKHYSKARGRDENQRSTLQSNKLSTLMGTLKSRKVVPKPENVMNYLNNQVNGTLAVVRRAIGGNVSKGVYSLNVDSIHSLLKAAFSSDPSKNIASLNINTITNLKENLEEYNKADEMRERQEERVNQIFKNKYHVVAVDSLGQYLVGTFRHTEDKGLLNGEVLRPFKRFNNLLDCGVDDLIPTLVMFKTMIESEPKYSHSSKVGNDIPFPISDHFFDELDMVLYYPSAPGKWQYQWMITPAA